jgi:hypothetical protein
MSYRCERFKMSPRRERFANPAEPRSLRKIMEGFAAVRIILRRLRRGAPPMISPRTSVRRFAMRIGVQRRPPGERLGEYMDWYSVTLN